MTASVLSRDRLHSMPTCLQRTPNCAFFAMRVQEDVSRTVMSSAKGRQSERPVLPKLPVVNVSYGQSGFALCVTCRLLNATINSGRP
jgi:hypothetical protein